jgi:salicylate hydroxylase
MRGSDFEGLTYDECLPIFRDKLIGRMKWVWGGDISSDYEVAVKTAGLRS